MKRSTWAVAALVATGTMLGAALATAGEPAAKSADLTGDWRLDPKRSDAPMGPRSDGGGERGGRGGWGGRGGGMGGGGRGGMGGEMGGGPGMGGAPGGMPPGEGGGGRRGGGERGNGERGPRMAPLPALIHVTHTPNVVSFEDSMGKVIQEVATVTADADTFARAPGAAHLLGVWDGATLEWKRPGPGGSAVTETWKLGDDGRTLVAIVKIPGNEMMPERTMKRVYARVVEP